MLVLFLFQGIKGEAAIALLEQQITYSSFSLPGISLWLCSCLYAIWAGYLCARLAKEYVFKHVTYFILFSYLVIVLLGIPVVGELSDLIVSLISISLEYLGAIIWLRKNKLADMSKPWWHLSQYWNSGLQAQKASGSPAQTTAGETYMPETIPAPESNRRIELKITEL